MQQTQQNLFRFPKFLFRLNLTKVVKIDGYNSVPWLEIFIDGCRIWPIVRKIRQKSLEEVSGLKIDGCMHPLPNIGYEISIDGCRI